MENILEEALRELKWEAHFHAKEKDLAELDRFNKDCELLEKLVDKQQPKYTLVQIIVDEEDLHYEKRIDYCPSCRRAIGSEYHYCPWCGQAVEKGK